MVPHAAAAAANAPVAFEPQSLPAVSVVDAEPLAWQGDLLAIGVAEDDLAVKGACGLVS